MRKVWKNGGDGGGSESVLCCGHDEESVSVANDGLRGYDHGEESESARDGIFGLCQPLLHVYR